MAMLNNQRVYQISMIDVKIPIKFSYLWCINPECWWLNPWKNPHLWCLLIPMFHGLIPICHDKVKSPAFISFIAKSCRLIPFVSPSFCQEYEFSVSCASMREPSLRRTGGAMAARPGKPGKPGGKTKLEPERGGAPAFFELTPWVFRRLFGRIWICELHLIALFVWFLQTIMTHIYLWYPSIFWQDIHGHPAIPEGPRTRSYNFRRMRNHSGYIIYLITGASPSALLPFGNSMLVDLALVKMMISHSVSVKLPLKSMISNTYYVKLPLKTMISHSYDVKLPLKTMISQSLVKLPKGIKDDFRILGNQQKHTKIWKHVLLLCFCNNQNWKC